MRFLAVTKRIFREMKNDRRTPALIFVAPIFAMVTFGLAFSGDVRNVDVVLVNNDEGFTLPTGNEFVLSDGIISHLDVDTMRIDYVSSTEDAVSAVENGEAYAAIIFPKDFTRKVAMEEKGTKIQIMIDKSNINVANAIIQAVNTAILDIMDEMETEPPLALDVTEVYGEGAEFIDFFVPGMMAFVIYLLTSLLALVSFVSERTIGTLDRVLASPLREHEIVLGYAAAFGIIGTVQTAILLIAAIVLFDITIVGNVVLAFAIIVLLAIVCVSLSILVSSITKTEAQAIQFLPFIVLPAFLLTGLFSPIEAIPMWMRPLSYFVPLTYAVDACRSILLRAWGFERIWMDFAALIVFAIVFLTMAVYSLRRRE